jgi:prophage tail gpP-like protein
VARAHDTVHVEIVGGDRLDNFTSLQISNDLMSPSEAAFELGNDGTWAELEEQIAHGTEYKVFINDRLRLTGRVEVQDLPVDAMAGSVTRFTVRTKLADAAFASALPNLRVKDTSIKEFILALYAPLGYTEADFLFDPATARDLLTGRDTAGKGSPVQVDLEPMTEAEAKVNPPETVYVAADRHLRRHGLIHWDAPDGFIVVSAPNDQQEPIYKLICNKADGRGNNVLGFTPTRDWSGVPSSVTLIGSNIKRGTSRKRVGAIEIEPQVTAAGFYRPVIVPAEGVRTAAKATRAAAREMSARRKQMDAIVAEVDALSFWDGYENVGFGVDVVMAVESDVAGGPLGPYFVHQVVCSRDADNGDRTNLVMLKKGLWTL